MHRFYLPPEQCRGDRLTLSGRDAHHAVDVLRLRLGMEVIVLDGAGQELRCEVQCAARQSATLTVCHRNAVAPTPGQLTLIQGLPKGRAMDLIVQKATELGAHRLVPLVTERSLPRFEGQDAVAKAEKWRLTAIEAIKQCGSAWLPRIDAPVPLGIWLERGEQHELALLASLHGPSPHPRAAFESFFAAHQRKPRSVCVWVGPEGDFTEAEIERIRAVGAVPVNLGPLVLRSDTAAIYCLSVVQYELQAP